MTVYGYIAHGNGEEMAQQISELLNYGFDDLILWEEEAQSGNAMVVPWKLKSGDVFLVKSIKQLRLTILPLYNFLQKLKEEKIEFVFLEEQIDSRKESGEIFLKILKMLFQAEMDFFEEKEAISKKRKVARGRPRIDKNLARYIQQLYSTGEYTLRDIAREVGVSIGTVYKYTLGEARENERDLNS